MKNKMRIAEKVFMSLMRVKFTLRAGFTLQIFSGSFMGQNKILILDLIQLNVYNN